ncbi:hypothetical protein ACIKTA_11465 [Hansschlegelia beijingensis]|uniref:hypothetical protein n=1 Tax=Hansschlegelia beijingensis TaxID=1133344 RepID=UPI0038062EEF
MSVVPFKRPSAPDAQPRRRSVAEFATAMAGVGLALFLLPSLWSGVPQNLLAVVHLLVAVVYFQQGPRIVAGLWIALSLVLLVLTGAPSPVSYALAVAVGYADLALR